MKNGKKNRMVPVAAAAAAVATKTIAPDAPNRLFSRFQFQALILVLYHCYFISVFVCENALYLSAQSHFDFILFYFTFLICCSKSTFSQACSDTNSKSKYKAKIK